ncbi:TRAP transporter large permease subunit [Oscillospiraceae bacterium MB24-C1]|nr:TRAP transporter large permease subunit [Oscillospiraceae bacterium MB24-C1]
MALLVLGVPIAFAIAVAGVSVLLVGGVDLLIVIQRMFASTDSFPLVAVPFFILAGDLLARGAMSKTLVEFAESILGRIRGGLSSGISGGGHVLWRTYLRLGRSDHCSGRRDTYPRVKKAQPRRRHPSLLR